MQTTLERDAYLRDLEYLVNIDSGSWQPEGTAKIAAFFQERFSRMGWRVKPQRIDPAVGPCLQIVNTANPEYDVLLMGHMDTVFAAGTAAARPFSIQGNKAHGPGVADMKAGLLLALYTLSSLQQAEKLNGMAVCVALNSDEEISSRFSRGWLEGLAKKSRHCLVLEPARANGNLVNARKGIARYRIDISGVAAHAGVDHEKGRSAIQELSYWIQLLHAQTNYETGTTVNVGMVTGGSAANVVAATATAEVDIRIRSLAEAERLAALIREAASQPHADGINVQVSGGVTRPPMAPSDSTLDLCRRIEKLAAAIGISLGWTATGGGSDGNFAANLGVPTVDGLGPIGGGAHSPQEYLLLDSIEPRFHLLRGIIELLTPGGAA